LYHIQKKKGIADLAATKYNQGGHTNEFFDNVFQNFEAFEQKDSDIKDHIFFINKNIFLIKIYFNTPP
jgi:hypothetical protein